MFVAAIVGRNLHHLDIAFFAEIFFLKIGM